MQQFSGWQGFVPSFILGISGELLSNLLDVCQIFFFIASIAGITINVYFTIKKNRNERGNVKGNN